VQYVVSLSSASLCYCIISLLRFLNILLVFVFCFVFLFFYFGYFVILYCFLYSCLFPFFLCKSTKRRNRVETEPSIIPHINKKKSCLLSCTHTWLKVLVITHGKMLMLAIRQFNPRYSCFWSPPRLMTILPPAYSICATYRISSTVDKATWLACYGGIFTDRQDGNFRHPPFPWLQTILFEPEAGPSNI